MQRTDRPRLTRNSASHVAMTDFPTPPLPFNTKWTSRVESSPFAFELSFAIRVPLLTKEWQGCESDSQINFFLVGSPWHLATRKMYGALLTHYMTFATGTKLFAA